MRDKIMSPSVIKEVMLSKDKVRLNVIRNLKSEIGRKENSMSGIKVLTDEEVISVIKKDIQSTKDTKSDGWELDLEILESFLPKQLSIEDMEAELNDLLSGEPDMNIGKIMKHFSVKFPNIVDRKELNNLIKK